MTQGFYKNHIDYGKHISYGKKVSYGKHINYNKPSGVIICDFTTIFNGLIDVNLDFIDDGTGTGQKAPSTGDSTFNNDNVIYNLSVNSDFDFSKEWTFNLSDILTNADTTDDGKLYYIADGNGSIIDLFYDVPNTRWRMRVFVAGGNQLVRQVITPFATVYDIIISSTGGTGITDRNVGIEVVNLGSSFSTLDYTGYVQNSTYAINIGGFTDSFTDSLKFSGSMGNLDFNSTDALNRLDMFRMHSRYLGCGDSNLGKIVGDYGATLTPTGGQEFTYPHYTTGTSFNNQEPTIIVLVGDSITAGTGEWVQEFETWLTDQGITNVTIHNLAVSGYDSFDGVSDGFPWASYPNGHAPDSNANMTKALSLNPHLIVRFFGQNDNSGAFTLAESEACLDDDISKCQNANVPLINFITMPRDITQPTNVTWADDFAAIQLTKIDNTTVWGVRTDILLGLGGSPNYLNTTHAPDLIHPDNSGDVLLAYGSTDDKGKIVEDGFNQVILKIFNALPCVVSDVQCPDNNLIIVDGITITDENGFARQIE